MKVCGGFVHVTGGDGSGVGDGSDVGDHTTVGGGSGVGDHTTVGGGGTVGIIGFGFVIFVGTGSGVGWLL